MHNFFGKINYLGLLLGACLLALGSFLLGRGPADNKIALNVAPFVLLLAYAVVLPLSIMLGREKEGK